MAVNNKNIYLSAIVIAILLNAFSWHLPFFWDSLLTSTITQNLYETGSFFSLPEYDAGHPPLFYIYVTYFYHVFGKNLFAAHVSMLPFTILGVISFIQLLCQFSFSKKQQISGVILYFGIPAVLTQNTLVSYDAVLLSVYLAALVSYFKKRKFLFSVILTGIVGISLRGFFCLATLSITIYFLENRNFKQWFKWNLYVVPSILIILCWYYYHYTQTGWWLSTNAEGWSGQRGLADLSGMFKNGFSIARCFVDLGIFVLSFLSLLYLIKKRKIDNYTLFWLIPALVFSVSFLPFTNPINHRYYLIIYVLMLLPVIQMLSDRKIIISVFTAFILFLGHFQIYPVPVSNGWDCTLKYTSYLSAKDDFDNLNVRGFKLDKSEVGTVFPMNASAYQTKMQLDKFKLINVNGTSIDSIPYILFSNVGNDFSDEQIKQLQNWKAEASFHRKQIDIILYRNPHFGKK